MNEIRLEREKSALSEARRHGVIDFRSIQRDGLSPGLDRTREYTRDTGPTRARFFTFIVYLLYRGRRVARTPPLESIFRVISLAFDRM